MGLDLTVGSAVLKEDYLGPLREQLNTAKVLLAEIEKNEEDVEGKYAVIPVTQGFPDGVGARAEKGDLPAAGTPSYDDLRVQMAYNYGRIEITGPSIKAMKSDRGSFIRAIDSQTKGMLNQLKKDYNRQLFGDGTGTLAKCGATSNSTTVVLADETDSMKFMRVGMDIDIIDVDDDSSVATNRKVTAIDRAKKTITISGASVTTDSTHRICRTGSWKKEINGLALMIATTGTYQNINRATAGNEYWHGNVFDAGGALRAISDDLLQQVQDACEENGEADSLLFVTTRGIRRKYVNTLSSQVRFMNTTKLKGGFEGITFNGHTIVTDADAPAHKVWAINRSNVQLYRMSDWEWMEENGEVLSRVSGKDAYEAVLFIYSQLGADRCNCHGVLADLSQ